MVSQPCSFQTSLDYDLSKIDVTTLSEAHRFAIKVLRDKCFSKMLPSSKDEIASADKSALQAWFEAQDDNRKENHPLRHYFDGKLRSALDYILATADLSVGGVFRYADVGPGATVGDYAYEGASFASKFDGAITYTNPDLVRVFGLACKADPRWRALFNDAAGSGRFYKVKGGHATFVPKTAKISRMVVTPPLLNGFTDRGVGEQLALALRHVGIDLSTQPDVNREMACIGSLNGELATLDLEGASSRLCWLRLQHLLPQSLQWWMRLTRPDVVKVQDEWIEMTEFQTMGSGITFPLQTAFFLAITKVSYDILGIEWNTSGPDRNVSCFGDDMIVHTKAFELTTQLLRMYGLKINQSKTFNQGCFRESCGADWYDGVNVRPVYVKDISTLQDRFTVINLLNEWSLRLGLPSLNLTIQWILGREIRSSDVCPQHVPEFAGIRVPMRHSGRNPHSREQEYRSFAAQPTRITIHKELITPAIWLGIMRGEICSVVKEHVYRIPNSRKIIRVPIVKKDCYEYTIRVDKPRYTRNTNKTPHWDANPFERQMPDSILRCLGDSRLASAWRLITEGISPRFGSQVGLGRFWDVNPDARTWIEFSRVLPS